LEELQNGDPPRVGPYLILGRLGAGGMGRVFVGRSPGGRLVAVKVIRAELAEDSSFRVRFAREVAAARRVGGLFTVPVVDADPEAPLPWLVTGYVAGPSLAQAVSDHGPLPVSSVLALTAGLAEGLGAIHAAGVVHRDLKPSNVLLAEDGPRVIDFGISQAADVTMMTGTGMVVGSPGFMSPEQAEGAGVGAASDIFSLGAVLAFAATGEPPFGTGAATAQLYRVVHGDPRLDQLPSQVLPLVERCLAKSPDERPTAAQLLAELTEAHPSAADLTDWLPAAVLRTSAYRAPVVSKTPEPAGAAPAEPGTDDEDLAGSSPPRGNQAASASGPPALGAGGPSTVTAAKLHHAGGVSSPADRPATKVVLPASAAPAHDAPDSPAGQATPVSTAPGVPASPARVAGLRRRRRRWAVAALATAVVLGAAAGLVTTAPWKNPPVLLPVLQPAGLIAGTATTSSVAFHWSSPVSGPVPDRYMIVRDGQVVGSVPGTVTFYQAQRLAPDTSYQYQVMAVRGGRRSARSAILTADTLVPPISAARLDGTSTAHFMVVRSSPSELFYVAGKRWRDSWDFTPHCTVGPCAVTISGTITGHPFTATLTRAGAVYTGTAGDSSIEICEPTTGPGPTVPIHDTLRLRIRIDGAGVSNQAWTATSWAGTVVMYSPYTPDASTPCPAYNDKFAIHGSFQ